MKPKFSDELLRLLQKISEHYQVLSPKHKRGRQPDFSNLSFLLLAVVAVCTKTFADSELFRLLQSDCVLRQMCGFRRVPHRTTILRRLKSLIPEAESQISLTGFSIVKEVAVSSSQSVSAIDGRMYQAIGAKWHKRQRQEGVIPSGLRNVDTESEWSRVRLQRLGARLPTRPARTCFSCASAAVCYF